MDADYLFVYGTLKRNKQKELHPLLAGNAQYTGTGYYQGKLYAVADYPGIVPSDNLEDRVAGEVFLLHQPDMDFVLLDRYEEIGPDFPVPHEYVRCRQWVMMENQCPLSVWIYLYNRSVDGLLRIEQR